MKARQRKSPLRNLSENSAREKRKPMHNTTTVVHSKVFCEFSHGTSRAKTSLIIRNSVSFPVGPPIKTPEHMIAKLYWIKIFRQDMCWEISKVLLLFPLNFLKNDLCEFEYSRVPKFLLSRDFIYMRRQKIEFSMGGWLFFK